MNRWIVKESDLPPFKWYADTIEGVWNQFPNAEVVMDSDRSYLEYIEKIKKHSVQPVRYDYNGREVYVIRMSGGSVVIKLSQDNDGYLDIAFYQVWNDKRSVDPVGFTLDSPKHVCELFIGELLTYDRVSYRQYGEPKLSKPKELKGVKQSFSSWYIPNKCKCPCFCSGNDLWIQHRDFFSFSWQPPQEDFGAPLSYNLDKYFDHCKSEKFVYPDCWGDIVLRDEAWIVFKNVKSVAAHNNPNELAKIMLDMIIANDSIARQNLEGYWEFQIHWERFFQDVCDKYMRWAYGEIV